MQTARANEPGCLKCHGDKARTVRLRARAGATGRLHGLPSAARLVESADADAASGAPGVPGVPLQPASAGSPAQRDVGNGSSGVPRLAQSAVSELHPLPPEGPWILCEPGIVQMRFLLAFLMTVPALAQQPAPQAKADDQAAAPAPAKADDQAKPADQAAAQAAAPAKADEKTASPAPAPASEQWFTGSFDLGYRWVTDVRGNLPRIPQHREPGPGTHAHRAGFHHHGSQEAPFRPHGCARLRVGRRPLQHGPRARPQAGRLYDLTVDYRNIAYFNACPRLPTRSRRSGSTSSRSTPTSASA